MKTKMSKCFYDKLASCRVVIHAKDGLFSVASLLEKEMAERHSGLLDNPALSFCLPCLLMYQIRIELDKQQEAESDE